MQAILDAPMPSAEHKHALGRGLGQRKIADAIDRLLAHFARFEQGGGALQTKDLRDARPSAGEPVIHLWTTEDVSMLQAAMRFVPRLGLSPLPIGGR